MAGHPDVLGLLEEMLDSGKTPEEVCRDRPELLPEVRRHWDHYRRVNAAVDALFPEYGAPTATHPTATAPVGVLPQIPGYAVEGELGRGGMGVVYKARHLRLGRTVALKMLLAGEYAGPQERARFQREAEAVASLRHPNIVQVYDVDDHDGRPYFTMEFVEGGTLADKLAGAPQPARRAAALAATLAEAVQAAHRGGVVHRDLKPGNVLLTGDGTPKVSDFGLARRLGGEAGATRSGAPLGTPSYMAPEQAAGRASAIGPATDVYALGAILYELLTGRPPFCGETASETVLQVIHEEPAPPSRLNARVPRDLETICLKCLHKDPHKRYASAQVLADDLRRFEKGEPITARPPGPLERAAKWARRRPTAAALLAAGLLMLVGVTAAAVWYASDRTQRARQVNREANAALHDAETHLKALRDRLDERVQAWELLSDIDQWQRLVEQARQDLERAKAACAGNEALLTEQTRDRMQAVEAAVEHEEAAYRLARELDDIAVEALAYYDARRSQQRTAVAKYERVFAQQSLDVQQPGTVGFASAIQSSPVRYALIGALDTWALLADEIRDPQVARLLELARAADPDPWRDRYRDPAVWADREALTKLSKEPEAGRQSPTVLVSLGVLLSLNGEDPSALFEQGLLDHPRDFWLHLNAALFITEPGVKIGLAHAALAIRPRNVSAYILLAWFLRERGDLPAALVAAKRAIGISPNFGSGYVCLGLSLREMKDLPGAVAALKKAGEIDSQNPAPFLYLGDVFLLQKDGAAAAEAYRKCTDRFCGAAAFWKLGGCPPFLKEQLRKLKDQPAVIAAFQNAIDLDPGDFLGRYILGQIRQGQGRYAEAEQAYLGAIKAQPGWVPACDSLARLLATCPDDKVRDGKRAVEYATTACERTGWADPFCMDTLAAAYAEAGQFDEAVRYQARVRKDPELRGDLRTAAGQRLEMYRQKKPFREQGP
jgi:serine/threonine-protein kinase